jgi:hypothetical protein
VAVRIKPEWSRNKRARNKKRSGNLFPPLRFDYPESQFEGSQTDPHELIIVISRIDENLKQKLNFLIFM